MDSQLLRDEVAAQHAAAERAAICVAACEGFVDPTALPECVECLRQYQNGGGNVSTTFRARYALTRLVGDDTIRHPRPSDLPPGGGNDMRCDQKRIAILADALAVYAEYGPPQWMPCEDNGQQGLARYFMAGTCHPANIAREALAEAGITCLLGMPSKPYSPPFGGNDVRCEQ